MDNVKDQYTKIEPPTPMRDCACCGAPAELWKYRPNDDILRYVPGCSVVKGFAWMGRQPCPMYELDYMMRGTKREAVADWNLLCDEITAKRELAHAEQEKQV